MGHYNHDLRVVIGKLSDQGLTDDDIRKIAFGNYARVLKQSMA
jgi:microsomal dipeptidase-like Zn-dependent dipeptidase